MIESALSIFAQKGFYMNITNADDLPLVLTISQVSEILVIGENSAYDLIRSGAIKSFRVGRQIRVSKSAFLEFISK